MSQLVALVNMLGTWDSFQVVRWRVVKICLRQEEEVTPAFRYVQRIRSEELDRSR